VLRGNKKSLPGFPGRLAAIDFSNHIGHNSPGRHRMQHIHIIVVVFCVPGFGFNVLFMFLSVVLFFVTQSEALFLFFYCHAERSRGRQEKKAFHFTGKPFL
jgi:hypothetical protein